MNKAFIVLQREYLTRVKKKSFLIATLITPIFMLAVTILPGYLATVDDKESRTIAVIDETSLFLNNLPETQYTKFHYLPVEQLQSTRNSLGKNNYYAVLHIPANILTTNKAEIYADKQVTFDIKEYIQSKLGTEIERLKKAKIIAATGMPDLEQKLEKTRTNIDLSTIRLDSSGNAQSGSAEMSMVVGYIAGFMIYMFIFIYGSFVMRGVMEEKSNRIVEVIVSSVKPFQLMLGKIMGIALVGLTQVAIWVIIGAGAMTGIKAFYANDNIAAVQAQNIMSSNGVVQEQMIQQAPAATHSNEAITHIFSMIDNLPIPLLIGCFIFFFLGGYLLYSSMMGAIGAAVDSEEDAQQFMLPVTIPLILSIVILVSIAKNPEGPLAFWTSLIPFTSPVIMIARIPFGGVPTWQIILSMAILVATIVGMIWVTGKIYRTGILMYGKKASWKEIWKWLRYNNY
ncbi:MAG: ABC transporter permease [Bacteroidota bacterium]|nr:ABC transporter permease [Bacteroidota bacterium]